MRAYKATTTGLLSLLLTGLSIAAVDDTKKASPGETTPAAATVAAETDEWRSFVAEGDPLDEDMPSKAPTELQIDAISWLQERQSPHQDLYNYAYVTDDGVVQVPVKAGQEAKSDSLIEDARRAFPELSIERRDVPLSFRDVQDMTTRVAESDLAGARVTGANYLNHAAVLLVMLDVVSAESVAAVRAAIGDQVLIHEGDAEGELLSGPERRKDRYPYSGAASWSFPTDTDPTIPYCSTAFGLQRADLSKEFASTAGHCQFPNFIPQPGSLNGAGTTWNNLLGYPTGYVNTMNSSESSVLINGRYWGDATIWRHSGSSPTMWLGQPGAGGNFLTTVRAARYPVLGTEVAYSAGRTGSVTNPESFGTITALPGSWFPEAGGHIRPVFRITKDLACGAEGDSGGAIFRYVSGGVQAIGIISGHKTGIPCYLYATPISDVAELTDTSVTVNP